MRAVLLCLLLLAAPAAASDVCHNLWFTRAALYDRAGYCFDSALGQRLFDNSDCTTDRPRVSGATAARIEAILAREAELGCAIPKGQRALDILNPGGRLAMRDLPLPEGDGVCIGYRGPERALRSGHGADAPVTGRIRPGDTLGFLYREEDGWVFLDPDRGDGEMGWMESPESWDCERFAG